MTFRLASEQQVLDIRNARARIWRSIEKLEALRVRMGKFHCPAVDQAIDAALASLITGYAAPLIKRDEA